MQFSGFSLLSWGMQRLLECLRLGVANLFFTSIFGKADILHLGGGGCASLGFNALIAAKGMLIIPLRIFLAFHAAHGRMCLNGPCQASVAAQHLLAGWLARRPRKVPAMYVWP